MKSIRPLLFLLGLSATSMVQAEQVTVQGKLTHVIVQPSAANPTLGEAYIALNPKVTGCYYDIVNITNSSSAYGRAVVASALTAQSGSKTVSVSYEPNAGACKLTQFVVLTP